MGELDLYYKPEEATCYYVVKWYTRKSVSRLEGNKSGYLPAFVLIFSIWRLKKSEKKAISICLLWKWKKAKHLLQ